jgi:hypothetical protein
VKEGEKKMAKYAWADFWKDTAKALLVGGDPSTHNFNFGSPVEDYAPDLQKWLNENLKPMEFEVTAKDPKRAPALIIKRTK